MGHQWGVLLDHRDISASAYAPTGTHKVLWDYWREMQQASGELVPPHAQFRPSRLASILPKLALSEYIDRDTQKVRVVGGGHDGLLPRDIAGLNLFDFVDPVTAETRKKIYDQVISRPCGCYSDEIAVTKTGRRIHYKGLFLPMLNKSGEPKIFIGAYDVTAEGFSLEEASMEGIVTRTTHDVCLINMKE